MKDYTRIPNQMLRDPNLSWQAKGLLCYMLSHSDAWRITMRDMLRKGANGRDATYSIVSDLVARGYLVRIQEKDATGAFTAAKYIVQYPPVVRGDIVPDGKPDLATKANYGNVGKSNGNANSNRGNFENLPFPENPDTGNFENLPFPENPETGFPETGFPETGFPETGFPDTENPDAYSKTKNNKTKNNKTKVLENQEREIATRSRTCARVRTYDYSRDGEEIANAKENSTLGGSVAISSIDRNRLLVCGVGTYSKSRFTEIAWSVADSELDSALQEIADVWPCRDDLFDGMKKAKFAITWLAKLCRRLVEPMADAPKASSEDLRHVYGLFIAPVLDVLRTRQSNPTATPRVPTVGTFFRERYFFSDPKKWERREPIEQFQQPTKTNSIGIVENPFGI